METLTGPIGTIGAALVPQADFSLKHAITMNAYACGASVQSVINMKAAGMRVRIQPYQVVQVYDNMTQFYIQTAAALNACKDPAKLAQMAGYGQQMPLPAPAPTAEQVVEHVTAQVEAVVKENPDILASIAKKHGWQPPPPPK